MVSVPSVSMQCRRIIRCVVVTYTEGSVVEKVKAAEDDTSLCDTTIVAQVKVIVEFWYCIWDEESAYMPGNTHSASLSQARTAYVETTVI